MCIVGYCGINNSVGTLFFLEMNGVLSHVTYFPALSVISESLWVER